MQLATGLVKQLDSCNMERYIKAKNIILPEIISDNLKEGDRVDISINPSLKADYSFPAFELGIKDEYLNREKILNLTTNSDSPSQQHDRYSPEQSRWNSLSHEKYPPPPAFALAEN